MVHHASSEKIDIDVPGCGGIVFDTFDLIGDGTLSQEIFTSGEQLVVQITAGSEGASLRAVHWSGTWWSAGQSAPLIWKQGYQSGSASGVFALDLTPTRHTDGYPNFGGALEVADETPWSSWWVGAVGREDGVSVGVGAVAAQVGTFVSAFESDGTVHAIWGGGAQNITLGPGESIMLDPLWMGVGPEPRSLLEAYADRVVENQPPRDTLSQTPPSGWRSRTAYVGDLSEQDVRDNLDAASRFGSDLGRVEVFELDDGWQRAWGDWTANDQFPSGMAVMAAEIRAEGFTPGLWMAPFYVDEQSALVAANPNWWVRGSAGELRVIGGRVVVDSTQPAALEWMAEQVSDRVDEGWDFLQLDFLSAGAIEGVRRDPVSGVQAYRLGMDAIREAAGDTWILASGAPLLPSVGYADSFRTGADMALDAGFDPSLDALRNQTRSTAARSWTNGRWWWVDPDAVMIRPPMTAARARGAAVANAISGGAFMLGDDLSSLSDARLRDGFGEAVLALRGATAIPVSPWSFVSGFDTSLNIEADQQDDQVPTHWVFADGSVALLNLSAEPVALQGPGGVELLTGATSLPGQVSLAAGEGQIWVPAP